MIPRCQFLIKKGAPIIRENIFGWTKYRAEMTDVFEPFNGELPPTDARIRLEEAAMPEPKMAEETEEEVRQKIDILVSAIGNLNALAYTSAGLPKISALQNQVDFDVNSKLRDEAWAFFKEINTSNV